MSDKKQANEDEVFEFLNSLPDQKEGEGAPVKQNSEDSKAKTGSSGKTDQEIIELLYEIEATNKDKKVEEKGEGTSGEVTKKPLEETREG